MRIRRPCVNHQEAEGRCGRAERDRPANCRDVLVSDAKCRRDSPAVGGTRFSRDARPCPATIAAHGKTARWPAGSTPHCHAPGIAASGVRQRVAATVGAQSGRAGNRRQRESRDRAPHAQKSGLTNRKIASWAKKSILPPDADAGPRGCPRGPPGRSLGDRRNTRPACGKASGQPPACPVFHGIYGQARRGPDVFPQAATIPRVG